MSIALPEVIQQAQQSLENGDYQDTVATCSTIVNQYPACEAAYRLLGEALLEQGQASEAERAYARAISHDPRQPASYLGLGRIAEERGVQENALAYCQVAWELAPNLPEYREPVVQVASRRFGEEGHLQLTHAALAQMHMRSSRMQRAVREYQIALSALPDRVDLWIGLAESLWRLGQDIDAAEIAREFLKEHPDLIQALVILADIEHRQGNGDEAGHLLERLRRVDPDGVTVRTMVSRNSLAAADFLLIREADMPVVEAQVDVVTEERPQIRIAPAPDFGYESPDADEPVPEMEDLQPIGLEEFGGEPGIMTGLAAAGAVAAGAAALSGDDEEISGQSSEDEFAELTAELGDLEPMAVEEFGGDPSNVSDDSSLDSLSIALGEAEGSGTLPPVGDAKMDDLFAQLEEADAGEVAEVPASDEFDDLVTRFDESEDLEGGAADSGDADDMADLIAQFDDIEPMGLEEFGAEPGEEVAIDIAADESLTIDEDDDAILSLASSLEDSVADALGRAGEGVLDSEPEPPRLPDADAGAAGLTAAGLGAAALAADRLLSDDEPDEEPAPVVESEIEAAPTKPVPLTPPPPEPPESGTGYTMLLGELGEEGLDPFDPARTAEPLVVEPAGSSDEADTDAVDLTAGWDSIDEEISNAMPVSTGNTESLLALENLDVEPFEVEPDEEISTDFLTSFSPFGGIAPAAAAQTGEPDTDQEPVEDLASGLAAFAAEATPEPLPETGDAAEAGIELTEEVPAPDLDEPAVATDAVIDEQITEYEGLEEIEPFAVEEFDGSPEEESFSFGPPPWQQDSTMAMPSDEDLDAALESEPAPMPESPTLELEDDGSDEQLDVVTEFEPDADLVVGESAVTIDRTPYGYDDQPTGLDASLAVTREIGQAANLETDDDFDAQLAAAESAAAERLEERHTAEHVDPVASVFDVAEGVPLSDEYPVTAAEQLVTDEALFERSREAKQELMAEGVIAGNRELTDNLVAEALPTPAAPVPEPEALLESEPAVALVEESPEPEIRFETGAMHNPDTLRAALQAAPDDDEMRWYLAEALRERGDTDAAMVEYRWLIRHTPGRHDAVMLALNACIDEGREVEMSHRLLADIYRRRGDRARASSQAQMAMKARRSRR